MNGPHVIGEECNTVQSPMGQKVTGQKGEDCYDDDNVVSQGRIVPGIFDYNMPQDEKNA
jgi:hypothetical protein